MVKQQSWQERLAIIMSMMREMSLHNDPQEVVRVYGENISKILMIDRFISMSRRELVFPQVRITRSSTWKTVVNPWQQKDQLPILKGGVLADWLYGNETVLIQDFSLPRGDPAAEYLEGVRTILAIPNFDHGESLNMVLLMRTEPHAIDVETVPELVWQNNLFGRATQTLVVRQELKKAYEALDHEMKVVADIQRSLLPARLPEIKGLDLAAYYQPANRAGGDYYDFFPLSDGRWGIFIADVSGHGTPSAVVMAVTHCIAHTHPGSPFPPGKVLEYINRHLCLRYTESNSTFVTAFYGIYDPERSILVYANAGHNPPRLKRCNDGKLLEFDQVSGLPLGISLDETYAEASQPLLKGDQMIFYTDGITEAHSIDGGMFGTKRMDEVLENCSLQAKSLLNRLLESVTTFAQGKPADDDRTVIVARVV